MAGIVKGFRDFVMEGDLINVAVGLVMALATFKLIEAFVDWLLIPLINVVTGDSGLGQGWTWSWTINGVEVPYGFFVTQLLTFVLTAAVVYFCVVVPYRRYKEMRGIAPENRPCPECTTSIPTAAKRCPACTAVLTPAA